MHESGLFIVGRPQSGHLKLHACQAIYSPVIQQLLVSVESMERVGVITLRLPPLSGEDPLIRKKQKLLHTRTINSEFQIHLPGHSFLNGFPLVLDKMVESARIMQLNELELYFVGDEDIGPFSPRNEIESLTLVLSVVDSLIESSTDDTMQIMNTLRDEILMKIKCFGDKNLDKMAVAKNASNAEAMLLEWGENRGVSSKLQIACFDGAGRGAVASEDINIGDIVLEIPESILIDEEVLKESDMFQILKNMDEITSETMLLLWSMKEKRNPHSKFKTYFDSLPTTFNTGLNFGIDALAVLEGTLLFEEIMQAREHLHQQYETLCPMLCSRYPDTFQHEMYTWDQFLWACELWYSNSMKVISTDGKLKTCLVPIAGLLNHSLCPHILHYGKVDMETKSLMFRASRPCKEGEQCYLSYGNYSASHLITFYGFLPRGDNPYDVIPLEIDTPQVEDVSDRPPRSENDWSNHMVRGSWFTKTNGLYNYGLPPPLLAHLRATLQEDNSLPTNAHVSTNVETEKAVLDTIRSIFSPIMVGLGESDYLDRESAGWDVKLALEFKDIQRRIICSVLDSCEAALGMLDQL